ncbi:hypothetical protein K5D34_02235 [Pseudomonas cichorii]|nr:hypothetical protein [Pseudomonas cichorii]MBX8508513.1 hypothetical protein [Pseudomonas cichorii]MBX8523827.1 hypothetical protein [Pseudomonas cichorii]MBX8558548.1 hypothetical protein [Pseudomonas cichorii]
MSILLTTQCADKALRSTSAVYYIAKATYQYGEEAVINEMAKRIMDETDMGYGKAVTTAATRHEEIMSLSDKAAEYKSLNEDLTRANSGRSNPLPA